MSLKLTALAAILGALLSSCAQRSGRYEKVNGKWTFVPSKRGFKQLLHNRSRVYQESLSMRELAEFMWPVPSSKKVSSSFGKRGRGHHDGIDIPSKSGSSILASADGTVSFSGKMRGYGNIVVLKHDNGFHTVYAHNSSNLVRKGESVSQGEVIARVGNTGRSTGPHLHYEVRKNNQVINPMRFFEIKSRNIASR